MSQTVARPLTGHKLVTLANGVHSVHSLAYGETFHPVIGPVAEAEALYVRQLGLVERLHRHTGEFVLWDVGLGAAANALTVLRATRDLPCAIHLLGYLKGYEEPPRRFLPLQHTTVGTQSPLPDGRIQFEDGVQLVTWDLHLADFPSLLKQPAARKLAKPHAIMFDAFSPAKNPAMWTQPLFANLFQLLDPDRPCSLPTYSRSTMLRVTLLLA